MTDLAVIAPGLPARSQALRSVLSLADRNADLDAVHRAVLVVEPGVRAEAARQAEVLGKLLAPATPDRIVEWLLHLPPLLGKVPEDHTERAQAMASLLTDLPRVCFGRASLSEARFKFWPTLVEVREAVAPIGRRVRREVLNLRAVAEAPETVVPERKDMADPAHVARVVAEFRAHVAVVDSRRQDAPGTWTPKPMRPEHVAAMRAQAAR